MSRRLRDNPPQGEPTEESTEYAPLNCERRARLVLAFAEVLYVSGQSTEQTIAAASRLARALGLSATLITRWGELTLSVVEDARTFLYQASANPTGVEMDRVASVIRAICDVEAGRLGPDTAATTIDAIARLRPSPTWLFMLAAGAGSLALAVIFGVQHVAAAGLIFVGGCLGALLRRGLARLSENLFLQPFCAALLAGLIGGLAVRYQVSSSLRLVAVCPCMVLVPGPHFLNGMIDLARGRLSLGASRLLYAILVVAAISAGLLLGLACFGASLPIEPPGRIASLWRDVVAAGVAVAAYCVFFSAPFRMLPWPVGVGMVAHASRWVAITQFGAGAATGALVAALVVGLTLTPVARRDNMPFAAIGFAAVVSMIPGVYLFRMAAGLLQVTTQAQVTQDLIAAILVDGANAAMITLALSFGLIVPKLIVDACEKHAGASGVLGAGSPPRIGRR
ncbi:MULTISPECIES: threonine/serine ThrE exporter family protein [unclassified Bradyrhizobium]|uniref:threonine/serine ThrE exporter family protein n=1 Tax=Bradyrhizobium TaxID=374 RepID=UPI0028E6BB2C|nr:MULTISPECIES: threonine/serine exporter family protein [unclassified Bradyrhizobium]